MPDTTNYPLTSFATALEILDTQGQKRVLPEPNNTQLNLSSNDYLGLKNNNSLRQEFWAMHNDTLAFGSSSSRLLTGNSPHHNHLEQQLATAFNRHALLFNSGYHANIGILPAISDKKTLILSDKWVHASLIDGIRLSQANAYRYAHNDYDHLHTLLAQYHKNYERIIIVTESVFSMDGDVADLSRLVALKHEFGNIMLYVDEAHAIGIYGATGLGLAEEKNCIHDIDFLVGTFGKAIASVGAYVVCDKLIKTYLVNTARPLIFSTALPEINIAWTQFIFDKLPTFDNKRHHLHHISSRLRRAIAQKSPYPITSYSPIIPYVVGDNKRAVALANQLQRLGFYCLPIRPPTVPKGTARIRFSLTANITDNELSALINALEKL